jgi:hypothetical protein
VLQVGMGLVLADMTVTVGITHPQIVLQRRIPQCDIVPFSLGVMVKWVVLLPVTMTLANL